MKKHNFNSGPCMLPKKIIKNSSQSLINFNNLNLSLIEISHRSKDFFEIINRSKILVKKIMKINDDYEVLFLQGGASLQFVMVPINLFLKGKASYLDTGIWSSKAIEEAKYFGKVNIAASSKDRNYTYIPKFFSIPNSIDYFHCTSNNTIYGTQMKVFPNIDSPLVCDMSSDIFSRKINFSNFDLIYASAQKNIGTSGNTLVVIKKKILQKTKHNIPNYLDYKSHIEKKSIFNTPSVFSVYVTMLTLEWIENNGGLSVIENINKKKSKILYKEIDKNPFFKGIASLEDRSDVNITFKLLRPDLSFYFDKMCEKVGIIGIKGHRFVGNYRASIYNAISIKSVKILIKTMKEFTCRFI